MTIAINATSAKMGGALTYLLNLISELEKIAEGDHFFVYASDDLLLPKAQSNAISIVRIPAAICDSPARLFWWQNLTFPHVLKKINADVLFSTANFATLFPPCPQALLVRIPHYFSDEYIEHILPKKSPGEKIDFYLRRLLIIFSARAANHVIFPSKAIQDGFSKHCFDIRSTSSVKHYGVPVEKFQLRAPTAVPDNGYPRTTRILCTSHYSDYKNYTTLLQALLDLQKQGVDFLFTAPVNLDLPLFKKALSNQKDTGLANALRDHLELIGPISYAELPKLYADADIFVWPSLSESFGHPLIEAMAAGVPIICADIPVNRELCGDAALFVPPLDSAAWARTIRELASNSSEREKLASNGIKRVSQFVWHDHVERLLKELHNVSNQRSHPVKE